MVDYNVAIEPWNGHDGHQMIVMCESSLCSPGRQTTIIFIRGIHDISAMALGYLFTCS